MEQNKYPIETYFARQALEGRELYRSRKGRKSPPERALYLSVLRSLS